MSEIQQPNDDDFIEQMQYIGDLFFRRLHGGLDEMEQVALDAWLAAQSQESRDFFEAMQDWEEIRTALGFLYAVDRQAALADVQKKILRPSEQAGTGRTGAVPTGSVQAETVQAGTGAVRRTWFMWAAAALVLALAGGAALLLWNTSPVIGSLPVEQRFKNDLAPGGQRATLQLSNGRQIALDSAADGILATQGGSRVVKENNGQLAYDPAGSKQPAVEENDNRIITPRGGQYKVILPDGSRVWLNAATTLRFPAQFKGTQRRVELSGEAYFEVAKNPAMPFIVAVSPRPDAPNATNPKAPNATDPNAPNATGPAGSTSPANPAGPALEIKVLGTRFDVEAYPDESAVRATLVDGSVRVGTGRDSALLTPGREVSCTEGAKGAERLVLSSADTTQVLAWKNGLFQFKNAQLETIMRQVSRWYNVDVVYKTKIKQSFTGTVPRTVPASTLLKILESAGAVHFTIEQNQVTVVP